MAGYLKFIQPKHLNDFVDNNRIAAEQLFPELIKRLIDASCLECQYLRCPDGNSIDQRGFDVVVENTLRTRYVSKGDSVWELGTNVNIVRKMREDYRKRTKNPLGIKRHKTTFYLCTMREWPKNGKTITKLKSELRGWKYIRIFDANILADWINQTPEVCAWLIEKLKNTDKTIKIKTLERAWHELSNRTDPALSKAFFCFTEKRTQEKLESGRYYVVCATDKIDAYGYMVLRLMQERPNTIVVNDEETLKSVLDVAQNQTILIQFISEDPIVENNNTVVMCLSKDEVSSKIDIELDKRSVDQCRIALGEMGISAVRTNRAISSTHCKTYPIIRHFENKAYPNHVKWGEYVKNSLAIEALLYTQQSVTALQKRVLEELTGVSFDNINRELECYSKKDDSPVILLEDGSGYTITSIEDALMIYKIDSTKSSFKNAHGLLIEILESINKNGEWEGVSAFNTELRELIKRLAKCYVYVFYTNEDETEIETYTTKVLEALTSPTMNEIKRDILRILAEVNPRVVVQYLKQNLTAIIGEGKIVSYYDIDRYFEIFGLLAENEQYFNDACEMIISIITIADSQHCKEQSIKLLAGILAPYNTLIFVNNDKRRDVFRRIAELDFEAAELILKEIMGLRGYMAPDTIIEKKTEDRPITYIELSDFCLDLARILMNHTKDKEPQIVIDILDNCEIIPPSILSNFLRQIRISDYSVEQIAALQSKIYMIKKYSGNQKMIHSILPLEEIILEQNNGIDYSLFDNYYETPFNLSERKKLGLKKEIEEADKIRWGELKKAKEKIKSFPLVFSKIITDDCSWGFFLANYEKDHLEEYIKNLSSESKPMTIAGIIDGVPKERKKAFMGMLDNNIKNKVLYHCRGDMDGLLSEEEELIFWKDKELANYSENAFNQLLVYHPTGLLRYLAYGKEATNSQVVEVLRIINTKENSSYNYERGRLYAQIAERFKGECDSDLICEIALLIMNGYIQIANNQSDKYYYNNTDQLFKMIEKRDKFLYHDLFELKIPECAFSDEKELFEKLDTIREKNDEVLEVLLSNTILLLGKSDIEANEMEMLLKYIEKQKDNELIIDGIAQKISIKLINGIRRRMEKPAILDYDEIISKYSGEYKDAVQIFGKIKTLRAHNNDVIDNMERIHNLAADNRYI